MEKLRNKERINRIVMHPTAYTKCVIGQDWYKNELEVDFTPGDCYPDYMEVNEAIMKEVDGRELNIEEVVEKVFQMLSWYQPVHLKVTDRIVGCKTHFDVEVIKEN